MNSRNALIAALVLVEAAVGGEIVLAIRGGHPAQWFGRPSDARVASAANLREGGAHRVFTAGSSPALTVDIGNADLTIQTGSDFQFDISLSPSTAYGIFRAREPIAARQDGDTVRIVADEGRHWSIGDDRLVTIVVPPRTRVIVAHAGDITADGLRAEASFNSANGTVTVRDYAAPALHVTARNDRISLLRIVADRLDVTSDDGRIEGTALQVRDGNVESANGEVRLGFTPSTDTLVTAETSNGVVRVSDFSATAPVSSAREKRESSSRSVRIGAGTGRLDVHSENGNIDITQT